MKRPLAIYKSNHQHKVYYDHVSHLDIKALGQYDTVWFYFVPQFNLIKEYLY